MQERRSKGPLVLVICLLAVLLAALLGVLIILNGRQALQQPVPTTTAQPAPTTTAQPETTPEQTTPAPAAELSLDTQPESLVWSEDIVLSGTADPREALSINGQSVTVEPDGRFQARIPLEMGKQTLALSYMGQTQTYEVERRYAMQSFTPGMKTSYHANQTMSIRVIVKEGSELKVEYQGKEIQMRRSVDQLGGGAMEGFVLYTGAAAMPASPSKEQNLGKVTYRVSCDGVTETYESADVICAARVKNVLSDPAATPEGYWNVGSGYIVEITDVSVETLNGKGTADRSDPTNNYLPKGTVDYGSEGVLYNETGEQTYRLLRCGVRVYNTNKNTPNHKQSRVVDCYYGKLPDHNEIGIASLEVEGHHTYLTLDCLWKAPFYFDFEEQEYEDASKRKYYVEKFDARYVDIRFCYATQVTGELNIPEDHPLFKSAELISGKADMTLRLWLKQEGGLYGWDAHYNENDQLVFQFLNPVTVTKADNAYGADLTGVTIMIDVGHGGEDIGAAGRDSRGIGWTEKERNLLLAQAVKKELESVGATVIMNRTTGDEVVTQRERIMFLKQVAPDYCLAIHHNSAENKEQNGYEAGFYYPFQQRATEHTHLTTRDAKIYKTSRIFWFYYYVSRQTICPVVLTENGYMSNVEDLEQAILSSELERKAQALTQGVCNYYLELSGLYTPPGE